MGTPRLLRNASAPGWTPPRDILIQDGRFARIGARLPCDDGAVTAGPGRRQWLRNPRGRSREGLSAT